MSNFYQKDVPITRHAMPFYQRPDWNTEHINNSILMWKWHNYSFEVTRGDLRPGWSCKHSKLFTLRLIASWIWVPWLVFKTKECIKWSKHCTGDMKLPLTKALWYFKIQSQCVSAGMENNRKKAVGKTWQVFSVNLNLSALLPEWYLYDMLFHLPLSNRCC